MIYESLSHALHSHRITARKTIMQAETVMDVMVAIAKQNGYELKVEQFVRGEPLNKCMLKKEQVQP